MNKSVLKPHMKNEYLFIKKSKEDMLLEFPTENKTKEQELTIKTLDAKLFIYSGLYNNNKTHYDKGIKKFKKSTIEALEITADVGCSIVNNDKSVDILDNSEAVRQLGIVLKEEYDEYVMLGSVFFG